MTLPVGCAAQPIDFAAKRLVLLAQIAPFLIESLDALVESLDGGERPPFSSTVGMHLSELPTPNAAWKSCAMGPICLTDGSWSL